MKPKTSFLQLVKNSFPSTAIVLAGGLGTRLRSVVQDVPKPMAPVADQPFLYYVLQYLSKQGIKKVVLSIGYKGEVIVEHFGNRYFEMDLEYVVEDEPLGTGGAIKAAMDTCSEAACFVLNGDTIFEGNLKALYHLHENAKADLTMSLKRMYDFDRYGLVVANEAGRVKAFKEKQYCEEGLINAGVYLVNQSVFEVADFPAKFSFEKALLEAHLQNLKIMACPLEGYFIDIGIPTDFAKAQIDFKDRTEKEWTLFLDRDGVINQRKVGGYIERWEEFEFLNGVLEAIATFSEPASQKGRSYNRIVIVTNQQGVAKGLMTEADVENVHNKMLTEIEKAGGRIDKVYYCPESAQLNPPCRKPNTGMALQAQKDFSDIDFSRSVMVGDSVSDMEFGRRLGMQTVLIETKEEEAAAYQKIEVSLRCKQLIDFVNSNFVLP